MAAAALVRSRGQCVAHPSAAAHRQETTAQYLLFKAISPAASGNQASSEPKVAESRLYRLDPDGGCRCSVFGLGYWVALARPQDPNAWFILLLLSYPEAFISVSTFNWWPGIWLPLRLIWHVTLERLAPAALLFLGLLFPERSRIDTKFPWVQVAGSGNSVLSSLAVAIADEYGAWYSFQFIPNVVAIDHMNDKVLNWTILLCIAIYWISILTKCAASPMPTRGAGSASLHKVRNGAGQCPDHLWPAANVGIADPANVRWVGYLSALLMLAFPLSLAYVVVVQRAMDVRILLRMGTKYALARGTVWMLRTALLVVIGIYFWQTARAAGLDAAGIARLVLLALLLTVASPRISEPISRWIDRRFFRDAHSAELVLNELSESVRTMVESKRASLRRLGARSALRCMWHVWPSL